MNRKKSSGLKDIKAFRDELIAAIGSEKVKDDEFVLATYGSDISLTPYRKPGLVVLPQTREDIIAILKHANKRAIPVTVMSGGVNVSGLTLPVEGGVAMDLRRMDRIVEINTDSGYAVIEPGLTFNAFTSALAKEKARCHVPTSPGGSTVLGNYLMRPSGSLCTRHLDPIIDLEVVLADGTVFRTGSSQFPNAGSFLRYGPHPDFSGIFCCAYGTLGVVTKASVRIYPVNESNRLHIAGFEDYSSSVKYVKDVINHNIAEHCIIWLWTHYMSYEIVTSEEFGITLPPSIKGDPRNPPSIPYNIVLTLMSGYEESMVTNEAVLRKVAQKYGGRVLSEQEATRMAPSMVSAWKEFYQDYHQPRMEGLKKWGMGRYMAWLVSAEPEDVVKIEALGVEKLLGTGARPVCYYSMPFDFGRCMLFRLFTYVDTDDKELTDKVQRTFQELYTLAMEKYNAVPFRYRGITGTTWLKSTPEFYNFYKRVKKTLDPNNILNRNMQMF